MQPHLTIKVNVSNEVQDPSFLRKAWATKSRVNGKPQVPSSFIECILTWELGTHLKPRSSGVGFRRRGHSWKGWLMRSTWKRGSYHRPPTGRRAEDPGEEGHSTWLVQDKRREWGGASKGNDNLAMLLKTQRRERNWGRHGGMSGAAGLHTQSTHSPTPPPRRSF